MKIEQVKTFEDWKVDDQYTMKQLITQDLIRDFSDLTKDANPVHKGAGKKGRLALAQGALLSSFAATLVGNHLPGPGSIYLGQFFKYVLPVFSGETLDIQGTIREKDEQKSKLIISITGRNSLGETAFFGEMEVQLSKSKEETR